MVFQVEMSLTGALHIAELCSSAGGGLMMIICGQVVQVPQVSQLMDTFVTLSLELIEDLAT